MIELRIVIASLIIEVLTSYKLIHIMQLNSYNVDQQIIWLKKNRFTYIANIILLISSILCLIFNKGFLFLLFSILIYISLFVVLIENFPRKQKKKLVWTKRALRLFAVMMKIIFLFHVIILTIPKDSNLAILHFMLASLSPVICFVSFLIMTPVEKVLKLKYINEAKKILKSNQNLNVIGITGSFGKTSVKYFLKNILIEDYNVCMTKGSFNTPMGVVITIRNELKNYDDIFICEMGARRKGDIKELCDIVSPDDCIITEVGNQHLDTFKNIDNVLKTKFELVDSVYNNGKDNKIILLNGDNELIVNYAKSNYSFDNIWTFGLKETNDFYAKDIKTSIHGTSFVYVDKVHNIEEMFNTKLLGVQNIINLVASISFATFKNVDIKKIKSSVSRIAVVEHRLELKKINENNIMIDDCYNSNVKGVRYAIDVLNSFDNYKKVLITPGIVELGDRQYIENKEFINYADDKTDYILVVGKTNKQALMEGSEKCIYFDKVEEAINYALYNINDKKVILLENDLPDNY